MSKIIPYPRWQAHKPKIENFSVKITPEETATIDLSDYLLQGANLPQESSFVSSLGFEGASRNTVEITDAPNYGQVVPSCDQMGLVYIPNSGFVGSDCFNYKLNNGTQDSDLGRVIVSVGYSSSRVALRVESEKVEVPAEANDDEEYYLDYTFQVVSLPPTHLDFALDDIKTLDQRYEIFDISWKALIPVQSSSMGTDYVVEEWIEFARMYPVFYRRRSSVGLYDYIEFNYRNDISPISGVFENPVFESNSEGPNAFRVGKKRWTFPDSDIRGVNPSTGEEYIPREGPPPIKANIKAYVERTIRDDDPDGWTINEFEVSTLDNGDDWWTFQNTDKELFYNTDCGLRIGCTEDGSMVSSSCANDVLVVIIHDNSLSGKRTNVPFYADKKVLHVAVNETLKKYGSNAEYLYLPKMVKAPVEFRVLEPTKNISEVRKAINNTKMEAQDDYLVPHILQCVDYVRSFSDHGNIVWIVVTDGADALKELDSFTEQQFKELGDDGIYFHFFITNTVFPGIGFYAKNFYDDLMNQGSAVIRGTSDVVGLSEDAPLYRGTAVTIQSNLTCGSLVCDINSHTNIRYRGSVGGSEDQVMDFYVPDCTEVSPFIPVVLIHGGNWTSGDKQDDELQLFINDIPRVFKRGTNKAALFTINFRQQPSFNFPSSLDDIDRALSWIESNANLYSLDMDKVIIVGLGSGGTMGLLYAMNPDFRKSYIGSILKVIAVDALYDLRLENDQQSIEAYLGTSDASAKELASPINYLSSNDGLENFICMHAETPDDPSTYKSFVDVLSLTKTVRTHIVTKNEKYKWITDLDSLEFRKSYVDYLYKEIFYLLPST